MDITVVQDERKAMLSLILSFHHESMSWVTEHHSHVLLPFIIMKKKTKHFGIQRFQSSVAIAFCNSIGSKVHRAPFCVAETTVLGFPGGPSVKNPAYKAANMGLSHGPERLYFHWNNQACTPQALKPRACRPQ